MVGRTRRSCDVGDGCFHRAINPGRRSAVTDNWVQWRLKDSQWVATARQRLQSISWFMKSLKEPLSRLANRQDKVRGAFFEVGSKAWRYSMTKALRAIAAYIDLNPVAAGIADVPETSAHMLDQGAFGAC